MKYKVLCDICRKNKSEITMEEQDSKIKIEFCNDCFTKKLKEQKMDKLKEFLIKYKNNKFFSPAYNAVYDYHQGKFYKALGEAIYSADSENKERLQKAYPEMFKIMSFLENYLSSDVKTTLREIER